MNYAYQASFRSIWNDFDHLRFRDHNFTYPRSNGIIRTIAWEGFREAVDDARYLATLEKTIANAEVTKYQNTKLLNKAKKYLTDLKENGTDDLNGMREKISEYASSIGVECY